MDAGRGGQVIIWRCDRCSAEEQAGKTGAKPTGWTIGTGADLCPECSRRTTADEARKRETT